MSQKPNFADVSRLVDAFGQPTESFPYEVDPSPIRDPLSGSFAAGIQVKTFLFLDDNEAKLLTTDFLLEPLGEEHTIEWASDYQEALERSVYLAAEHIKRLNTCQKI